MLLEENHSGERGAEVEGVPEQVLKHLASSDP
jgi:hypothetical protein